MSESRIPVDLFNPGQVFACLGFLEAAEVLLGDAEGGFDWRDPGDVRFILRGVGVADPVGEVLEFLATTKPRRFAPQCYCDPPPKKKKGTVDQDSVDRPYEVEQDLSSDPPDQAETFPSSTPDRMSLPIRLGGGCLPLIELTHWADGSNRDSFKLYAGNRSAFGIAVTMRSGLCELYAAAKDQLIRSPFEVLMPMGGSFNFDPRGAWTALDAGYSLNEHKHRVHSSPVVELLAPWGLENARPKALGLRTYAYAAWQQMLTAALARPALACALDVLEQRRFRVSLDLSGKNKVMTYAEEDVSR